MSDQSSISDFLSESGGELEIYECEICDRTFDSSKGKGIHRAKAHAEDEIKQEMLAEVQRLAAELGKTPSQREMNEQGRFSVKAYQNRFGTWNKALNETDLSLNKEANVSDADLLAELRRLSDEIGETPTSRDMAEKGKYAPSTYTTAFGSWNNAVREAGLDTTRLREVPESELLDELESLADQLGQSPTFREMEKQGRFGARTYSSAFGSWNNALREANLDVNKEQDIPRSNLLGEIKRLEEEQSRVPTSLMMDKNGRFTVSTYNRVFGSWNEALREAGCDLNNRNNIPEAELLDEIKRLQSELGRTPTAIDMESKGEFGWATYETAFGSWNAAVQEAGFEPNGRINIEKSELIDAIKSLRTRLGQTPGRRDMDRNGQFDSGTYLSTFGSWNNALREADIEPNKRHDVSDTELIEAIEQLRDTLGRVPTRVEMDNQGAFSGTTYRHRFGSWSDALVTAGLNPNGKLRPDHLDHIVR